MHLGSEDMHDELAKHASRWAVRAFHPANTLWYLPLHNPTSTWMKKVPCLR